MTHIVYLALGSNIGNREDNLRAAMEAIAPEVSHSARSPVYETAAWGYTDQPQFLNQVMQGQTELAPLELLAFLKQVEVELGREPTFRYGPRKIDIDILFYDDLVLESDQLTIPHARLAQRAFVLVPLDDIAPNLQHAVLKRTVRELLAEVDRSDVKPLSGDQPVTPT